MTEQLADTTPEVYPIEIRYSNVDKCYIANSPDLPGCKAHGDTQEEALQELKTVIKLWLEIAVEQGKDIPIPNSK